MKKKKVDQLLMTQELNGTIQDRKTSGKVCS